MMQRKRNLAHDFIDRMSWSAAEQFVRSWLRDQIDIVHVRVQLHPITDRLLDTAVDAGDGGGEFVLRHRSVMSMCGTFECPGRVLVTRALIVDAYHQQLKSDVRVPDQSLGRFSGFPARWSELPEQSRAT